MDKVEVTIRTKLVAEEEKLVAELDDRNKENDVKEDICADNDNFCEVKLTFGKQEPSEGIKETIGLLSKVM